MNRIVKNIVLVTALMILLGVNAQQDPTYTLYAYNMNVVNPGFAGSVEGSQLTANFRSQWVGIPDSPEIQSFSYATAVGERIGLGVSVINSQVFVLGETDLYADFSYKVPISRFTDLYLGVKAGGSSIKIDLDRAEVVDDPLFTENVSRFNPNIGVGAYLKGERFWISASAPTLLKSDRFEKEAGVVTTATDQLHFFMGGGYTFFMDRDVTFTPSLMARTVQGTPLSLDLTATFGIYEKIELGINHRLDESISGIAFFNAAEWVAIGYAYEGAITQVNDYARGTHEIMMQFRW
ncbi:MAG: type IX secretion system membrane protein PorP/SprF [Bacteroidota bacterium]